MKNKDLYYKLTILMTGVLAGMVLTIGLFLGCFGGPEGMKIAGKAAAVYRVIRSDYVGDYDPEALSDAAADGMISALDDRWSFYMDEDTYESYQSYSENSYHGIGVTVQKDEETGGFLIVSVTKNGPAWLAGMEAGDIILSVDGESVTGLDVTGLKTLIQQAYGRNAVIELLRETGQTEELSVSCEDVFQNPVSAELLDGSVGYISIANFRQGAGTEAIAAVDEMIGEGAGSLLFDVRSDPGGQVTELCKLLDYLLPEGDIFIRADKKGREVVEVSDESCVELPMAVLVNGDSYSAAEFFAAALQEYGAAAVVGEHTTGKARSQITVSFRDKTAVHISKYTYLTPNRTDLFEAGGITPDVEAAMTEEERQLFDTGWLEPEDDPQIRAALAVLNA